MNVGPKLNVVAAGVACDALVNRLTAGKNTSVCGEGTVSGGGCTEAAHPERRTPNHVLERHPLGLPIDRERNDPPQNWRVAIIGGFSALDHVLRPIAHNSLGTCVE